MNMLAGAEQIGRLLVFRRITRLRHALPLRKIFRVAFLALAIGLFGLLVGAMAVLLPPMFAAAAAISPIPFLIWAAPELRSVPINSLRKAFYLVLFAQTSIPVYYTIIIPGFPWMSVRRVFVFSLVILLSLSIAGSREVRMRVSDVLLQTKKLSFSLIGFYIMCVLSLFSSASPAESLSHLVEVSLSWYIPAIACIISIRTTEGVRRVFIFIGLCSLLVATLGVVDFFGQTNYAIKILPEAISSALMQANPDFVNIVATSQIRNGLYRADSIFNVPLSFGEFAAMVAPIGLYFSFEGEKHRERLFGAVVVIAMIVSLFVSGARGGRVAFVVAVSTFFVLWAVRTMRLRPRSMVGALLGSLAFMGTTTLLGLVLAVPKFHIMVFGGGAQASSNEGRWVEAAMAWPHILANPVTGHGLGLAAQLVGYSPSGQGVTMDSFILSTLVDTGVPGFLFYFGAIAFASVATARLYVSGHDRDSAVGAALASSLAAYGVYRLVLSQGENQTLFFVLVAATFVVLKIAADRDASKFSGTSGGAASASSRRSNSQARGPQDAMAAKGAIP